MGPNFDLFSFIPEDKGLFVLFAAEALIGIATVFVYIPIIAEFNFIMNYYYPNFGEEVNADLSSALFMASDAGGTFFGPIVGKKINFSFY